MDGYHTIHGNANRCFQGPGLLTRTQWGSPASSQEPNIVICTTAHAAFDKVSTGGMGHGGHGSFFHGRS